MRIFRWRGALAALLLQGVVKAVDLKVGGNLGKISAYGLLKRRDDGSPGSGHVRALLRHLRKHRGRLPADFRFDRDEANARG